MTPSPESSKELVKASLSRWYLHWRGLRVRFKSSEQTARAWKCLCYVAVLMTEAERSVQELTLFHTHTHPLSSALVSSGVLRLGL